MREDGIEDESAECDEDCFFLWWGGGGSILVAARLTQRSDDTEEKVRTRLNMYKQNASLVEDKYRGKVQQLNGLQPKMDVFADIETVVKETTDNKASTDPNSVAEFVRKAEEAFEKGYFENADVNW